VPCPRYGYILGPARLSLNPLQAVQQVPDTYLPRLYQRSKPPSQVRAAYRSKEEHKEHSHYQPEPHAAPVPVRLLPKHRIGRDPGPQRRRTAFSLPRPTRLAPSHVRLTFRRLCFAGFHSGFSAGYGRRRLASTMSSHASRLAATTWQSPTRGSGMRQKVASACPPTLPARPNGR